VTDDPFGNSDESELLHPEFRKCETCDNRLIWDVWTSQKGAKCKAWRCPSKTLNHTVEFV
jgi:hypothetical protein